MYELVPPALEQYNAWRGQTRREALLVQTGEFQSRKAPYAPISALREFLERIRNVAVPARVDRRFLQRLNVAHSNEWALLSALKFLGIVDEGGIPTTAFGELQTTDRAAETLRVLVQTAYKGLLQAGGADMSLEDLRNYFTVTSSPSQAKNAARFFREVWQLAGLDRSAAAQLPASRSEEVRVEEAGRHDSGSGAAAVSRDAVLRAKIRLLEKMPTPRPDWTAEQYQAICDRFLSMLEHLEPG